MNGADFGKFTGGLNTAIGIFRDWEGLVKAIGIAIYELFNHDAGTGTSIVVELTNLIDKFNAWVQTTAGGDSLHALLESHKEEILSIIQLIGTFISAWGQVELVVRPILQDVVTGLADIIGFLAHIPGLGDVVALGLAFEILGNKIPFGLVGSFNTAIKGLIMDGLVALGGALSGLGGPFTALGGWLTGLGTAAPTEMETMAASWQAGV